MTKKKPSNGVMPPVTEREARAAYIDGKARYFMLTEIDEKGVVIAWPVADPTLETELRPGQAPTNQIATLENLHAAGYIDDDHYKQLTRGDQPHDP